MRASSAVEIEISEDAMDAWFIVHPAQHGGNRPDRAMIDAALAAKNVVHGVREDWIAQVLASMESACSARRPRVERPRSPQYASGLSSYSIRTRIQSRIHRRRKSTSEKDLSSRLANQASTLQDSCREKRASRN